MKKLYLVLPLIVLIGASCSTVKRQYSKDIPLDKQTELLDYYKNRSAWTRIVLEDLGEGGSIPRDTKVKIIGLDTHFTGSVSVETIKKDKRIVHGLAIERPLTVDKINQAMDDVFWFKDPTMRQVDRSTTSGSGARRRRGRSWRTKCSSVWRQRLQRNPGESPKRRISTKSAIRGKNSGCTPWENEASTSTS